MPPREAAQVRASDRHRDDHSKPRPEWPTEEDLEEAAEDDKPRGFFGFRKKPAAEPAPEFEEADLADAAPEAPASTPPRPAEPGVMDLGPEAVGDAPKTPN